MHLRKLVLACGFASLALSNYASALGLGEVKLKSMLNQPLSAEVQLLDTKGLSPEQIIVSMASAAEFERNGLDFTHFYTELKFEVVLDNPSGPIVRITSHDPVREPYLNFLVEAKWTSGRLLREYTLLMDLPTFSKAPSQVVQAPQVTATKTVIHKASQQIENEVQATVDAENIKNNEEKPEIIAEQDQTTKKPKVTSGTYGPVGDKDTLWDIAQSIRPDTTTSVHQTMMALQRLNPNAFIHGNVNLLKKGQVLRVPDAAEVSSISKSEAAREFNQQVADWTGASAANSNSGLGAQLDASQHPTADRVKSDSVAGRVTLEAPTSKEKSATGQGSGANKGSGKALESELATTMEELDRVKSEKTELSSRVHALEDQVKTMQRLVDVSNEKMRALQLNASKQPDKTTPNSKTSVGTVPEKATPETPAVTTTLNASSNAAVSREAKTTAVATTSSVAPKKPLTKPIIHSAVHEKTIVDQLKDNGLWLGLGVLVILLAGAIVISRRKKAQADAEKNELDNEEFFSPEPNFDSFNQHHEEEITEPSADELALFEEEGSTAVAETGDVVGEADIYIAYGKYDQAEEMLINGLEKDPTNTDIRLKLLEVYSQTQNKVEFDKHYAIFLPIATGFALTRAKELRANIPGIDAFSAAIALPPSDLSEEPLSFNESFDLNKVDAEPTQANIHSHDDLDFDLDLDDVDINATTSNYGMDFNAESNPKQTLNLDDDFTLSLDSAAKHHNEAEDLSDISLALDKLDKNVLPHDVEVSARAEDDFNFDFDELDNESNSVKQEVNNINSSEFNSAETLGDDFNLDMDVSDADLAALDNEMANFDSELDKLDDNPASSVAKIEELNHLEAEKFDAGEFSIDSLDDDLAKLSASSGLNFDAADLNEKNLEETLDFEHDDSDLEWEDDEIQNHESAIVADNLSIDDDDEFDFEAENEMAADVNLQHLNDDLIAGEHEKIDILNDVETLDAAPVVEVDNNADNLSDDDMFEQALSDFSAESLAIDDSAVMSENDMDAELDFMADADEAATKLDLARAYIDMGDSEGARDILAEVAHEGNEQQRQEAVDLLSRIDA